MLEKMWKNITYIQLVEGNMVSSTLDYSLVLDTKWECAVFLDSAIQPPG